MHALAVRRLPGTYLPKYGVNLHLSEDLWWSGLVWSEHRTVRYRGWLFVVTRAVLTLFDGHAAGVVLFLTNKLLSF